MLTAKSCAITFPTCCNTHLTILTCFRVAHNCLVYCSVKRSNHTVKLFSSTRITPFPFHYLKRMIEIPLHTISRPSWSKTATPLNLRISHALAFELYFTYFVTESALMEGLGSKSDKIIRDSKSPITERKVAKFLAWFRYVWILVFTNIS